MHGRVCRTGCCLRLYVYLSVCIQVFSIWVTAISVVRAVVRLVGHLMLVLVRYQVEVRYIHTAT